MNKTTEQFESTLNQNPLGLSDSELDKAVDSLLDYLDIDIQNKEPQRFGYQHMQINTTQKADNETGSSEGLLSML